MVSLISRLPGEYQRSPAKKNTVKDFLRGLNHICKQGCDAWQSLDIDDNGQVMRTDDDSDDSSTDEEIDQMNRLNQELQYDEDDKQECVANV